MQREGQAIGQEVKALGRDMILGPTVNINRVPLWGRNFEGYGEDPYLAGRMGVAYIRGVQGEGVIPSVKHFAANNEEFERHRIDAHIDERTLHEIYLPAFKAAVAGGPRLDRDVGLQQGQRHPLRREYSLLNDVLQKEFGFKGFVISDWGSTYSTAPTVNAGMDLEMPGGPPMKAWLERPATQASRQQRRLAGSRKGAAAEVKAGTHLRGHPQRQRQPHPARHLRKRPLRSSPHRRRRGRHARRSARRAARAPPKASCFSRTRQPAPARPRKDPFHRGHRTQRRRRPHRRRRQFARPPKVRRRSARRNQEARRRRHQGQRPPSASAWKAKIPRSDTPEARAKSIKEAAEAAAQADVAVVVVGRYNKLESEGFDVKTMDLPAGQDELIAAVEKANPHTVVVLNTGDPVTMTKMARHDPALLDMWYGGQEGGHALGRNPLRRRQSLGQAAGLAPQKV